SINVCPISTFVKLGISEGDLQKITTQISAYDNSKWAARGAIKLQLQLGPAVMITLFMVMDIISTFQAILGRPWVEQTLGIPSTIHQCYKFPYEGKILRVRSVPQVATVDMFTVENLPPPP